MGAMGAMGAIFSVTLPACPCADLQTKPQALGRTIVKVVTWPACSAITSQQELATNYTIRIEQ